MTALEKEPHFASTIWGGCCALITYQVILMPLQGRNNRISSISLSIAWLEIQVWWLIDCALKIRCFLKTFKTNCVCGSACAVFRTSDRLGWAARQSHSLLPRQHWTHYVFAELTSQSVGGKCIAIQLPWQKFDELPSVTSFPQIPNRKWRHSWGKRDIGFPTLL